MTRWTGARYHSLAPFRSRADYVAAAAQGVEITAARACQDRPRSIDCGLRKRTPSHMVRSRRWNGCWSSAPRLRSAASRIADRFDVERLMIDQDPTQLAARGGLLVPLSYVLTPGPGIILFLLLTQSWPTADEVSPSRTVLVVPSARPSARPAIVEDAGSRIL